MHFAKAKGLLSSQNGMNLYRGCTHGCIYCDARSRCYQFTHNFEDVEVKENALELLEAELAAKRRRCMLSTGAMSDPYQPVEQRLRMTRKSLEIIHRRGFGLSIQTKSDRVLEDLPLLRAINERARCVVEITLTTFDEQLCQIVEPNVSTTAQRFAALCALRDAGIPTVVWISPILPFLNDTLENIQGLLAYCEEARVSAALCFGMGVTLREGDREYFYQKLDEHLPGLKRRYASTYGLSYECASPHNDRLMRYFIDRCEGNGMLWKPEDVFAWLSHFPEKNEGEQLRFF